MSPFGKTMTDGEARALEVRGLSKAYGSVRAVSDLDLSLRKGEIQALLGPSGCGKTTTLRLLAGLERVDEGEIHIAGEQVASPEQQLPPERRRIGMVFQHYALFPHLNAAENVAYGLSEKGEAAEARVRDMLALVGLSALGGRMPHELSGGQQQRVALARAMAPKPEVLLLDEPFSNLDARMRVTVREEVRDILKRGKVSTVFVTHDQEEALFIGDRIAILNGGRLEQLGRPETVFHRPVTRFVAEFMGHTGFLPAFKTEEGLETELGIIVQPGDVPLGAQVDLLLRPDDITVVPDPEGKAVIHRRVFKGMHNLYRVRLASGRLLDCLAPDSLLLARSTRVRVEIVAGHALECFVGGRSLRAGSE